MVITHTADKQGNVRLYLGGNASMECWIEPACDGIAWSFRIREAVTSFGLSANEQRACATHVLAKLCQRLNVSSDQLKSVPFETIAALHDDNPFESRRTATPKRASRHHSYVATPPNIRRPSSDFGMDDDIPHRMRQRS